jgi:hypothetical protein
VLCGANVSPFRGPCEPPRLPKPCVPRLFAHQNSPPAFLLMYRDVMAGPRPLCRVLVSPLLQLRDVLPASDWLRCCCRRRLCRHALLSSPASSPPAPSLPPSPLALHNVSLPRQLCRRCRHHPRRRALLSSFASLPPTSLPPTSLPLSSSASPQSRSPPMCRAPRRSSVVASVVAVVAARVRGGHGRGYNLLGRKLATQIIALCAGLEPGPLECPEL